MAKSKRKTKYTGAYLVDSFLSYYKDRGHRIVESAPLKPEDPTLLFTAAGMVPFKEYYSDPASAPYKTAASVQKCLRAGGKQSDLENVGRTLRHHTFFEMLGNFSFGDYFKKGAIETAWDLSVNVWGIDAKRIWVSVFEDDDEAEDLWHKRIGVAKKRIVRLGRKDNFWGPVGETGICGPSSELYFDTGEERGCRKKSCKPGCDCDRYIEYWNLVFPQFFYTEEGKYEPLKKPGIDTGMGLERLAFILQGVEDNYHTDIFLPVRNAVESSLPKGTRKGERLGHAVNASADHVRALVFTLSEGIMPSNEGRGYVLRRLLRRALTKMHPFGVTRPFLAAAVDAVIDTMGDRYPDIRQRREFVKKVITAEEEHFLSTIEQGWNKLQEVIAKGKESKGGRIGGKDAFVLYDTFGFPLEMTTEIALDAGLEVDVAGYEKEMADQKERSRATAMFRESDAEQEEISDLSGVGPTDFDGYENLSCESTLHLLRLGEDSDGVTADLVAERTVFYAEAGGQVGDIGIVRFDDRALDVIDTFREAGHIVHRTRWKGTAAEANDYFAKPRNAVLQVDHDVRYDTMRNHTATHLLHKALRTVLGEHVTQAGSLVAPDRLRFDFHHFQPMSADEVDRVTSLVNEKVLDDLEVSYEIVPYKKAIASGAMALFGEKYGDEVRLVTIDAFSKELCGGTHLKRTGEIGPFLIRQETAVASGVRRIEALTGNGALTYVRQLRDEHDVLSKRLRVAPEEIVHRVDQLVDENERLKKKLGAEEAERAAGAMDKALGAAKDIGGVKLVAFEADSGDMGGLRAAGDRLRAKLDSGVGLLCLSAGKKPTLLVISSDKLMKDKDLRADTLARRIGERFGLRGGGKPHMAQLGLADPKSFGEITEFVRTYLEDLG
jgi:alanyl-tRNA synthetase